MGMKKIYNCDICKQRIENLGELFGVNFGTGTLNIDGIHICYVCAKQLRAVKNRA